MSTKTRKNKNSASPEPKRARLLRSNSSPQKSNILLDTLTSSESPKKKAKKVLAKRNSTEEEDSNESPKKDGNAYTFENIKNIIFGETTIKMEEIEIKDEPDAEEVFIVDEDNVEENHPTVHKEIIFMPSESNFSVPEHAYSRHLAEVPKGRVKVRKDLGYNTENHSKSDPLNDVPRIDLTHMNTNTQTETPKKDVSKEDNTKKNSESKKRSSKPKKNSENKSTSKLKPAIKSFEGIGTDIPITVKVPPTPMNSTSSKKDVPSGSTINMPFVNTMQQAIILATQKSDERNVLKITSNDINVKEMCDKGGTLVQAGNQTLLLLPKTIVPAQTLSKATPAKLTFNKDKSDNFKPKATSLAEKRTPTTCDVTNASATGRPNYSAIVYPSAAKSSTSTPTLTKTKTVKNTTTSSQITENTANSAASISKTKSVTPAKTATASKKVSHLVVNSIGKSLNKVNGNKMSKQIKPSKLNASVGPNFLDDDPQPLNVEPPKVQTIQNSTQTALLLNTTTTQTVAIKNTIPTQTMKEADSQTEEVPPPFDEVELFANLVVEKLWKMSSEQRVHAENLINQVLYNGLLKSLTTSTIVGDGSKEHMSGNILFLKKKV